MTNYNETNRQDEHDATVDTALDHVGRLMLELLRASEDDANPRSEELLRSITAALTDPQRP